MNITTKLEISPAIRRHWFINNRHILASRSKNTGCFIFKFCYEVKSGEFLCGIPPLSHGEIIAIYGKKKLNSYVRGIYFREKKIVYLRQHENRSLLFQTKEFLRKCGVSDNIRIIWGKEAAQELSEELKGL